MVVPVPGFGSGCLGATASYRKKLKILHGRYDSVVGSGSLADWRGRAPCILSESSAVDIEQGLAGKKRHVTVK